MACFDCPAAMHTQYEGEMLKKEIHRLAESVAAIDPIALEAFAATARAMAAGRDDETALAIGNDILVKSGYKPLPVPDLLAKMQQDRGDAARRGVYL